jgi:DNA invertase Pin-like site-specific DNA recombinase
MEIGYIRISKGEREQNAALQEDAMQRANVEKVFRDVIGRNSGAKEDRKQFLAMLEFAREGDTIVVWRLDRLGRTLKLLIETVKGLEARGIQFRSITEQIDTSTVGGTLIFHIFGALAEWERGINRERSLAGLRAAKERGRMGGRPTAKVSPENLARAKALYEKGEMSVIDIMKLTGFKSRPTFYKYVVWPNGEKPLKRESRRSK